jgi:hypothetical protein
MKKKKLNDMCTITSNMASNLRLRQDDKVKIVPIRDTIDTTNNKNDDSTEQNTARSGDLLLLKQSEPSKASTVTFAPVEDSLNTLSASEGGDDISDDELVQRFITPYMMESSAANSIALLKQGHLVTLRDDNGKKLEFYISSIEIERETDESEEDDTEGKIKYSRTCFERNDYKTGV